MSDDVGAQGSREPGQTGSPPEGAGTPPEAPTGRAEATQGEQQLGEAGQAALAAERKARKEADRRAREAEARLAKHEESQLSETDRLKREAEQGRVAAQAASAKLQKASLLTALADEGFSGARAKAVSRLLEGVEFDSEDEPTNLKAALKAAEKEYGDLVRPQPTATSFDGGARQSSNTRTMDDVIRDAARSSSSLRR